MVVVVPGGVFVIAATTEGLSDADIDLGNASPAWPPGRRSKKQSGPRAGRHRTTHRVASVAAMGTRTFERAAGTNPLDRSL